MVTLQDYLDEQMKDPEFRKAYEAAEPAYQRERKRILARLTHPTSDIDRDLRPLGSYALASVIGCALICVALCLLGCVIAALVAWI